MLIYYLQSIARSLRLSNQQLRMQIQNASIPGHLTMAKVCQQEAWVLTSRGQENRSKVHGKMELTDNVCLGAKAYIQGVFRKFLAPNQPAE